MSTSDFLSGLKVLVERIWALTPLGITSKSKERQSLKKGKGLTLSKIFLQSQIKTVDNVECFVISVECY